MVDMGVFFLNITCDGGKNLKKNDGFCVLFFGGDQKHLKQQILLKTSTLLMITFQHQHGKHSRRTNGWTLQRNGCFGPCKFGRNLGFNFGPWKNERLEVHLRIEYTPWKWNFIIFQTIHFFRFRALRSSSGWGGNGESWCEKPLDFRGIFTFQRVF